MDNIFHTGDLIQHIDTDVLYVVLYHFINYEDRYYDMLTIVEESKLKTFIETQDVKLTTIVENGNDYIIENNYDLIKEKKYKIERKIIYTLSE